MSPPPPPRPFGAGATAGIEAPPPLTFHTSLSQNRNRNRSISSISSTSSVTSGGSTYSRSPTHSTSFTSQVSLPPSGAATPGTATPGSTRSKNDIFATTSNDWYVRPAPSPRTSRPGTPGRDGDESITGGMALSRGIGPSQQPPKPTTLPPIRTSFLSSPPSSSRLQQQRSSINSITSTTSTSTSSFTYSTSPTSPLSYASPQSHAANPTTTNHLISSQRKHRRSSPSPPGTTVLTPTSPTGTGGFSSLALALPESARTGSLPLDRDDEQEAIDLRFSRNVRGGLAKSSLLGRGTHGAVYLATYHKRLRSRLSSATSPPSPSTTTTSTTTPADDLEVVLSTEQEEWQPCAAKVFDADEGGRIDACREAGMLRYLHEPLDSAYLETPRPGEREERDGRHCIVGYIGLTSELLPADEDMDGSSSGRSGRGYRAVKAAGGVLGEPFEEKGPGSGRVYAVRQDKETDSRLSQGWETLSDRLHNPCAADPSDFMPPLGVTRSILLLEHCSSGTVEDFLARRFGEMDRGLWERWYQQGEEALSWCRARSVVHCDVKPGNLLLDEHLNVRLSDFNSALLIDPSNPPADGLGRGTLTYASPELVDPSPDRSFSFETDLFSFGVTMWQCLTGKEPYAGMRSVETIYHVRKGKFWEWAQERTISGGGKALRTDLMEVPKASADLHRGGSLREPKGTEVQEAKKQGLRRNSSSAGIEAGGRGHVSKEGSRQSKRVEVLGGSDVWEMQRAVWMLTQVDPERRGFVEISDWM